MHIQSLNGIEETKASLKREADSYRVKAAELTTQALTKKREAENYKKRADDAKESGDAPVFGPHSVIRLMMRYNALVNEVNALGATIAEYNQRAATLEASIISVAVTTMTAPSPTIAPTPAPFVAPLVTLTPTPVVTPTPVPINSQRMKVQSVISLPTQIPEAPLPVILPPVRTLTPAIEPVISEPSLVAPDWQKMLPWVLATGAAILFITQFKGKRRYV